MCKSQWLWNTLSAGTRRFAGPLTLAAAVTAGAPAASLLLADSDPQPTQAPQTAGLSAGPQTGVSDSRQAWQRLVAVGRRLEDPDPEVRKQAIRELEVLGPQAKAAVWALQNRLDDHDELVRAHAARALWVISGRPERTVEVLGALLQSNRPGVAEVAANYLASMGPQASGALPQLRTTLTHPNLRMRLIAAEAIAKVDPRDEAPIETIAEMVEVPEPEIRLLAAFLLADVGREHPRRAIPALSTALKDNDPRVRSAAELTLETLGWNPDALPDHEAATDSNLGQAFAARNERTTSPAAAANTNSQTKTVPDTAAATPAQEAPSAQAATTPQEATPAQTGIPAQAGTTAQDAAPAKENPSGGNSDLETSFAPVAEREKGAADARQSFENARNLAAQIEKSSEAAFAAGLMNLMDYAQHLEVALELKTAAAEAAGNHQAVAAALEEHIGRLRTISTALRKVTQPNSKRGQADLALLRMLAAQAQTKIARLQDDSVSYQASLATTLSLANEQYQLRVDEYNVGDASLDQLARAAAYLQFHPNGGTQEVDHRTAANLLQYQDGLRQIVERAEKLEKHRAGAGPELDAMVAKYELARTGALLADVSGDQGRCRKEIEAAGAHAARLFEAQRECRRMGTASLFDLAVTWMRHDAVLKMGRKPSDAQVSGEQSRLAALEELVRLADGENNRSGRTEADIALVHALAELTKIEKNAATRAGAASDSGEL